MAKLWTVHIEDIDYYRVKVLGVFGTLEKAKEHVKNLETDDLRGNYDLFREWADENGYPVPSKEEDFNKSTDVKLKELFERNIEGCVRELEEKMNEL